MLVRKSFAKVNLYLEVIGQNPQGYHLLSSLFTFLELHDLITIKESSKPELIINGEFGDHLRKINNNDNILNKTIALFKQEAGSKSQVFCPLSITLTKNIPLAAGLGGGSSNAATLLLMLNQFYDLNLPQETLLEMAAKLGWDVPFCLRQKSLLLSGVKQKVQELKVEEEEIGVLLVNPLQVLPTKLVFEIFDKKYFNSLNLAQNLPPEAELTNQLPQDLISLSKSHSNHLEWVASELAPSITEILNHLNSQEGCLLARMSGSGATCFGLFKETAHLKQALKSLRQVFPTFYVRESKIVPDISALS